MEYREEGSINSNVEVNLDFKLDIKQKKQYREDVQDMARNDVNPKPLHSKECCEIIKEKNEVKHELST